MGEYLMGLYYKATKQDNSPESSTERTSIEKEK